MSMKAIVYHGNKNLEFTESYPEPDINHGTEVKIKIDYCGICGTDLKEYLDGPIFLKVKRVKYQTIVKFSVWAMK